mgnify:CR=1 FL=1
MNRLDNNKVFAGFRLGLLVGALVALFKAPRIQLRDGADGEKGIISRMKPADPITESIAEGKEAARRRRAELGLD